MKISPQKLEMEDGNPAISYRNVIRGIQTWGSPVGMAHVIFPDGGQTTQVFFYDGWAHQALGFAVAIKDEQRTQDIVSKMLAFDQALLMMPGFTAREQPQCITDMKIPKSDDIIRIIIQPEDATTLGFIRESPGYTAIKNYIALEKARGHSFHD